MSKLGVYFDHKPKFKPLRVPKGKGGGELIHLGGGFFQESAKFFKGEKSVKPSSVLKGISGISAIGSLVQPQFIPILGPIGVAAQGGSKIFQTFGAGF